MWFQDIKEINKLAMRAEKIWSDNSWWKCFQKHHIFKCSNLEKMVQIMEFFVNTGIY
jgi:hypothetical protein